MRGDLLHTNFKFVRNNIILLQSSGDTQDGEWRPFMKMPLFDS